MQYFLNNISWSGLSTYLMQVFGMMGYQDITNSIDCHCMSFMSDKESIHDRQEIYKSIYKDVGLLFVRAKDGNEYSSISFVFGAPSGLCVFTENRSHEIDFYENGELISEMSFTENKDDIADSVDSVFYKPNSYNLYLSTYSNGDLRFIEEALITDNEDKIILNGIYFSDSGEKVSFIEKGKGVKKVFENNSVCVEIYDMGRKTLSESFDADGKKTISEYKKGLKHGREIRFFADSSVIEYSLDYKDGKPHGVCSYFDQSGGLIKEEKYNMGKIEN